MTSVPKQETQLGDMVGRLDHKLLVSLTGSRRLRRELYVSVKYLLPIQSGIMGKLLFLTVVLGAWINGEFTFK